MNPLKRLSTQNSKKDLARAIEQQNETLSLLKRRVAAHTRDCSKVISFLEKELLAAKPDFQIDPNMRAFIDNLNKAAESTK